MINLFKLNLIIINKRINKNIDYHFNKNNNILLIKSKIPIISNGDKQSDKMDKLVFQQKFKINLMIKIY